MEGVLLARLLPRDAGTDPVTDARTGGPLQGETAAADEYAGLEPTLSIQIAQLGASVDGRAVPLYEPLAFLDGAVPVVDA